MVPLFSMVDDVLHGAIWRYMELGLFHEVTLHRAKCHEEKIIEHKMMALTII